MKKKYIDKYFKKIYLTHYVTLVNINYMCQWIAKLTCSYIQGKGGNIQYFEMYIFSVVITVLEILIGGMFIYSNEKKKYEELVNKRSYKSQIINNAKEYNALKNNNVLKYDIYGFDFITEREKCAKKGEEIWIITGDLEEDVTNSNLKGIIHDNLEKGVIYRYFISKVNKKISRSASAGRDSLKSEHNKYWESRLFTTEIDEELIAPDVDIIIYNATAAPEKREGYVCVEIGNDESTYAYQKLDREIVTELYNRLKPEGIREWRKKRDGIKTKKWFDIVQIIYWVLTVLFFYLVNVGKGTSVIVIICTVIAALILWLITVAATEIIDVIFEKSFEELEIIDSERRLITEIMGEQPLSRELLKLVEQEEERVFAKMQLKTVDKIGMVSEKCQEIWLLTDLSHDMASKAFLEWLETQLNQFPEMCCKIIHTGETAVLGRVPVVEDVGKKYPDRIKRKQIDNSQKHYIWSETYGVLFIRNKSAEKNELYISLGVAEKTLYKQVEIKESESANVLGILRELYGS